MTQNVIAIEELNSEQDSYLSSIIGYLEHIKLSKEVALPIPDELVKVVQQLQVYGSDVIEYETNN